MPSPLEASSCFQRSSCAALAARGTAPTARPRLLRTGSSVEVAGAAVGIAALFCLLTSYCCDPPAFHSFGGVQYVTLAGPAWEGLIRLTLLAPRLKVALLPTGRWKAITCWGARRKSRAENEGHSSPFQRRPRCALPPPGTACAAGPHGPPAQGLRMPRHPLILHAPKLSRCCAHPCVPTRRTHQFSLAVGRCPQLQLTPYLSL